MKETGSDVISNTSEFICHVIAAVRYNDMTTSTAKTRRPRRNASNGVVLLTHMAKFSLPQPHQNNNGAPLATIGIDTICARERCVFLC